MLARLAPAGCLLLWLALLTQVSAGQDSAAQDSAGEDSATATPLQAKRVDACPTEVAFLADLDSAWASGEAARVLELFDFVHDNLRRNLVARLDPGMRREERRTTLVATFEIERSDARKQRACFLQTKIRPVATPHRSQDLFEVLVFRPRGGDAGQARAQGQGQAQGQALATARPRAMLLLPTTRGAQEHVQLVAGGDDSLRGLPIGRSLQGGCAACNWRVEVPAQGNWAMLLRDATFSGCAEHVEVYDLDRDLMVGLRVEPDCLPDLEVDLDRYLLRTRDMLARVCGSEASATDTVAARLAGMEARATNFEHEARTWRLIGLRCGAMTYLVNVHAPTDLFAREPAQVEVAIGSFKLVAPDAPCRLEKILAAHAVGKLGPDGVFRSRKFGLTLRPGFAPSPRLAAKGDGDNRAHDAQAAATDLAKSEGWAFAQPMGSFALQAYWSHPQRGRFVVFVLDSVHEEVDEGQAQRYLASWLARERLCGTLDQLDPDKIVRRRIAGQKSGWVDFGCASRGCEKQARAFAAAIPHGRRLVLIHGCAEACADQDVTFDAMVEAALGIELQEPFTK